MDCIQIVFGIRVEGTHFPEICFLDTTPEYKNITLKPIGEDKPFYEIWVRKNVGSFGVNEMRSVIQEAATEAETFIYVFSIAANVKIFDFFCKGYINKNDCLIGVNQALGQRIGGTIQANPIVVAGAESVERVKQKMMQNYDLLKLRMFYDSATITEPIGRFISLYTLMLHHCSSNQKDSQKNVDEAILKIDPTVAQYKSPYGNYCETVFTKLRNELSHKRDGVHMIETHNQIRSNIDRFEKIVKAYILGVI